MKHMTVSKAAKVMVRLATSKKQKLEVRMAAKVMLRLAGQAKKLTNPNHAYDAAINLEELFKYGVTTLTV